jgi:hypothetical protein
MAKHRAVSTGSYGLKEEIHYLYYASLEFRPPITDSDTQVEISELR